jgi:hypothetical protein
MAIHQMAPCTLIPIITIIHLSRTTRSMMMTKRMRKITIVRRKIMTKRKWYVVGDAYVRDMV